MAKFTSFDAPIGTKGPISVRRATAEDFGGSGGLDKLAAGIKDFGALMTKRQELHYMAELSPDQQLELYLDTV